MAMINMGGLIHYGIQCNTVQIIDTDNLLYS